MIVSIGPGGIWGRGFFANDGAFQMQPNSSVMLVIVILGLLSYAYAIWRIAHTWAGRSQLNLMAWLVFLGLLGGLCIGLLVEAARHNVAH